MQQCCSPESKTHKLFSQVAPSPAESSTPLPVEAHPLPLLATQRTKTTKKKHKAVPDGPARVSNTNNMRFNKGIRCGRMNL